jgi:competence protein ComEA
MVIILISIILLIICGIVYKNAVYSTQVVVYDEVEQQQPPEKPKEVIIENTDITVYVCGSVKEPVNVTLPKDSRIEDAIKLAGGATEQADLNGINMAQKLNDEDMVYVPKKGEIIEQGSKSTSVAPSPMKKGKININKATLGDLDALPGIGPAIAQRVIDYRDSKGGFKSIDELNNVSGIGEEKYKDIKSLITVD